MEIDIPAEREENSDLEDQLQQLEIHPVNNNDENNIEDNNEYVILEPVPGPVPGPVPEPVDPYITVLMFGSDMCINLFCAKNVIS